MNFRFLVTLLLLTGALHAQNRYLPYHDTILSHSAVTGMDEIIAPFPYDTSIHEGHTLQSQGVLDGVTQPKELMNYCTENDAIRCAADSLYSNDNFPFRAVVRIWTYKNGQNVEGCAGTLVGKRFVLTAAHCLGVTEPYSGQFKGWPDSVVVKAGYAGQDEAGMLSSISSKYYIIKHFIKVKGHQNEYGANTFTADMALLELTDPIGAIAGYSGIGFTEDTALYFKSNFVAIGYPYGEDMFHTYLHYDGSKQFVQQIRFMALDTLEYERFLYQDATTIPGYSGGPAFRLNDTDYVSYATGLTTDSYNRITGSRFFTFKNIIETTDRAAAINNQSTDFHFTTSPNPCNGQFSLSCTASNEMTLGLELFDVVGRSLYNTKMDIIQGRGTYTVGLGNLQSGLYVLRVTDTQGLLQNAKIMVGAD